MVLFKFCLYISNFLYRDLDSILKSSLIHFLGRFIVQNVSAQKDGEKSRVKVKVRVNTHGIFTISTASMVEKIPTEENEVESDMECQSERQPESSDTDVSWYT